MILAILIILIILIVGVVFVKYDDYKTTVNMINLYLDEHGYEEQILLKETKFNSKTADFYMVVYYKDLPEREYEYSILKGSIDAIAYERGVEIETAEYMEGLK